MSNIFTYHRDASRSGAAPGAAPNSRWHKRWEITLPTHPPVAGNAVRGAPLFLGGWVFTKGPFNGQTHDVVLFAASDNHVYAYADGASPSLLWTQFLGVALDKRGSNIPPPIGVSGTMLIESAHRRLFVVRLQDDGHSVGGYHAASLDIDTGAILQHHPLVDPGAPGRVRFDGNTVDQRGGLNLVHGFVFATFADFFAFDKGDYHGWIVALNADDLATQAYLPMTHNVTGGGVWGPGGAAADGQGALYAATGNAPSADNNYWASLPANTHPGDRGDFFEGVVRVIRAGTSAKPTLGVVDWYQPTNAQALNQADQDLGGSSPVALPPIGGKNMLVVSGKDGDVYLLDAGHLGHWGGELWRAHVFSAESKCAPATMKDAAGDYLVFVVGSGTPGVVAYKVVGTTLRELWRAHGLSFGDAPGSPMVGLAAGVAGQGVVWTADAGGPTRLLAFDAVTGAKVFDSNDTASDAPGGLPHFPAITVSGNKVFLGTNRGVICYAGAPATSPS